MNLDPNQIQLSPDQQAELADLSAVMGKPWPVVLHEALATYRQEGATKKNGDPSTESFFDAASRLGLIGSLRGGPSDLSSNPAHMEGFGQSDG
jgi:hypothetical protein